MATPTPTLLQRVHAAMKAAGVPMARMSRDRSRSAGNRAITSGYTAYWTRAQADLRDVGLPFKEGDPFVVVVAQACWPATKPERQRMAGEIKAALDAAGITCRRNEQITNIFCVTGLAAQASQA